MIRSLSIQNFALIDRLILDFNNGFTVITGETGSGKSILLGALNLILGDRADYSVIRDKDQKTVVEAVFQIKSYQLEDFFNQNELDFLDESIIRREISSQGKSRAFINDTPVSLQVLKELTEKLISINSQHQTIELRDKYFQLDLLDTLADTNHLKKSYSDAFTKWKKALKEKEELEVKRNKMLLDADYNAFQVKELEELNLEKEDFEKIESELNQLENTEDIKHGFAYLIDVLSQEGSQGNVLEQFSVLKSKLDKIESLHPTLMDLSQRVKSIYLEIKDIGEEAIHGLDEISYDPKLIESLSFKMDKFNLALRKHSVTSQAELTAIYSTLSQGQLNIDEIENQIQSLAVQIIEQEKNVRLLAAKLSDERKRIIPEIQSKIVELLDELKLPDSKFVFDIQQSEKLTVTGSDDLQILFTANKGMAPKSIEKAASGGELSRLMLGLQYLLSEKKQLATVIFDEIDTGVSGEVAQRIGNLLNKMGAKMQLLAITHLPQVASKGQNHWKVQKSHQNEVTTTQVVALNQAQRIEEVARLMSGDNINQAALENAKALMN
jgi:DNA repair protein RecN (Recombination protein N)